MSNKRILIVGGVAGGASTAARMRRLDEKAEIIVFERGEYISYANCGLPYYVSGEIQEESSLTLQTPQSFKERFNIDVRVFHEVVAIDCVNKNITVMDTFTKEQYTESYDNLVLSMGAEPIMPPIPGIDTDKVFTMRTVPDTLRMKRFLDENKPGSAVVVGGGYIGIEVAENLQKAGLKVTVLEMQNQVISPLDYDMACELHNHIKSKDVDLKLGVALKAIDEIDSGLKLTTDAGMLEADFVVMSVGVKPDTGLAKNAGLKLNPRGGIVVNAQMKTSDPFIYAVGDAVEVTDFITKEQTMIPLAGPANKQGRIVADCICGGDSEYRGTQGSSILRVFDMTAAATGINEKTAKRKGISYEKTFVYPGGHAGYYPGSENMSIKLIFSPSDGKVLGAQIVGKDGVDKRCDMIAAIIGMDGTVNDLIKLEHCYAPPFSSAKDPVNMAGFTAENIMSGKVDVFHWHDVENVLAQEDSILLDVRKESEFADGHVEGSVNIPLDSLRERMTELDASKKLYVTCQVGLRGYIACRILKQNDYQCWNLSGGYRLYNSVIGE